MIRRAILRGRGAEVPRDVYVAKSVELRAREISVGAGSYLGEGVRISADVIRIGARCHFAEGVTIRARVIEIGTNCIFFPRVRVHSLKDFRLGDYGKLSRGATVKAGNITIGQEFWMNTGAEIGGGGWRNPEGSFRAGDRCHVGRNTHINVARPVTLGDDTAVGMDCTLATHAHWQPITEGYAVLSGPITLGSDVAVYTRSIISPGVSVGDGSTIAAGSVVNRDVKERVLVGGTPARVLREPIGGGGDPAAIVRLLDEFIRKRHEGAAAEATVSSFWATLPAGQSIILDNSEESLEGTDGWRIVFLSFDSESALAARNRAECVFDLKGRRLYGRSSELSETLRTVLFSVGVKFRYCGYVRKDLNYQELIDSGIE
jgi:acetyltransferase-like isoleucine patch superfamily enzyme